MPSYCIIGNINNKIRINLKLNFKQFNFKQYICKVKLFVHSLPFHTLFKY